MWKAEWVHMLSLASGEELSLRCVCRGETPMHNLDGIFLVIYLVKILDSSST